MAVELPQAQFVTFDSEVQLTMALPQVQHSEKIIVCVSVVAHMTSACSSTEGREDLIGPVH